jgi:hypothetical protein
VCDLLQLGLPGLDPKFWDFAPHIGPRSLGFSLAPDAIRRFVIAPPPEPPSYERSTMLKTVGKSARDQAYAIGGQTVNQDLDDAARQINEAIYSTSSRDIDRQTNRLLEAIQSEVSTLGLILSAQALMMFILLLMIGYHIFFK